MRTADIRTAYLEFFQARGHKLVPSSSLVPGNDPTLLFTNSGMVQFKEALLGLEARDYSRATTAQRCVRAGGKHNDLENVGYTARHHTFFEMLGNFSFGDYFKEETISWAWEFVQDVLALPKDRIWVTVHPSDDESRRLWRDHIGIDADRVIDLEENFWAMGDTGPCGPCTELFFDHGPEVAGGPPGSPDEDGDRYVEFWNLVFPQFDRAPDGELTPLPRPGVDTGMGLERVAAIKQNVHSNYEIDLFTRLMRSAGRFAGINDPDEIVANASLRVIADHIRSSAFLIADGVIPGNEARSYVLRRIMRRGLRHGHKLGIKEPFFHKLVDDLVEEMGDAYPLLRESSDRIRTTIEAEELRFDETLSQGMEVLARSIEDLSGTQVPGDVVFQLYDTFGFPADLTADVARERGLTLDMDGFEREMDAQRERGRSAQKFSASVGQRVTAHGQVQFDGYDSGSSDAQVVNLFAMPDRSTESADGGAQRLDPTDRLEAGASGIVVLDRTPFYAEAGGQVGDVGTLRAPGGEFVVTDTQVSGSQHLHIGHVVDGAVATGESVSASIDEQRRQCIRLNHSATHLLHAALRSVLGPHVQQRGSLVDATHLRFDFSHGAPMTDDEISRVEQLVNDKVRANTAIGVDELPIDEARARGAMSLFGEKYGDVVRMLTMADGFSIELCGGTHAQRTGDIALLRVTGESGIAAGVRRIEAVTGEAALRRVDEADRMIRQISQDLKASRDELPQKVQAVLEQNRQLQKELTALKQREAASRGGDLASGATEIGGVSVVAARVEGDARSLPSSLDVLRSKLPHSVIVLAVVDGDSVALICGVSKELTDRITAPDLINFVGATIGARGGGRPDMARAGGGDPQKLDAALDAVPGRVTELLG